MAGAQIRYDGHTENRKENQKKRTGFTLSKVRKHQTQTETSARAKIRWIMQPRLARLYSWMVDSTTNDLLLVILTIAATTGILILIDTRVSVMALRNNGRWYARHILTFPAQRATCPGRPVRYRATQKEIGQYDVKLNMYQ